MKRLIYILSLVLLCGSTGCTENMKYRDGMVTPPKGIFLPDDGYFLELRAGSDALTSFSWMGGVCEDGYPVQYEILFTDAASGGKELARVDAGVNTEVIITHKELNRICGLAGVEPGGTGTVYWTPVASRGINIEEASVTPFKLDLKRLLGFEFIPERLYLVGTGTEGGTDPATAIPFNVLDEGEYEIYTELYEGEYLIVDDPFNPQHTYGVQGALAVETPDYLSTPKGAIFRIRLDFNVKSAVMDEITNLGFFICHRNTIVTYGSYIGLGKWVVNINLANYGVDDYGKGDNRYHFRAIMPGVPGGFECWGPLETNQDGQPALLTAVEYFYMDTYPASITDQWGPKFKFHSSVYKETVDIIVDMAADIPTHYFEIL